MVQSMIMIIALLMVYVSSFTPSQQPPVHVRNSFDCLICILLLLLDLLFMDIETHQSYITSFLRNLQ